jgi:hypothetical protein
MEQEQERWLDAMFADLPVEGIDELMTALSDLRRSVERSNP